jgi:hypothetical protein
MRCVIVTPYYQESRDLLERCMRSVKAQTVPTDHILVADGHAQSWIDGETVTHLKLPRAHADWGNTPRGVGALLAIGQRYDAIGLLDADNWLEPDHVAECLHSAAQVPGGIAECDYVIAKRTFRRLDDTVLPVSDEPNHMDTNCFFFLPGSYSVVPRWTTMPAEMSPYCDRAFQWMIEELPLTLARTEKPTVNYRCTWESVYRIVGEEPPPGAKPSIDVNALMVPWVAKMTPRDKVIASRLSGVNITAMKVKPLGDQTPR